MFDWLKGKADESPPGLLLEVEGSPFLTGAPGRLRVFEDGIEVVNASQGVWGGRQIAQRASFAQISQVVAEEGGGFLASRSVSIQTTGGGVLMVNGLTAKAAEKATNLLVERMTGA